MINSHHVNSQTALLSGADAVILRTFEAKIHFVDLSVFHGRAHGRQFSLLNKFSIFAGPMYRLE